MNNMTGGQLAQIYAIATQQRCGRGDVQFLIESGFMADFFAGRWQDVRRNDFRKLGKLDPEDFGVKLVEHKEPLRQVIKAINIFRPDESSFDGEEFLRRAKQVHGWETGDQEAFDYYKTHPEELPKDVNVLIFANTQFCTGVCRYVRCLCRDGTEWCESCIWIDGRFFSGCRVAVLTSP